MEIKLRLNGAEAHAKLAAALKQAYRTTHEQENYFFDGAGAELSKSRVILRIRFYNHDKRALLTVKVRKGGLREGGGEGGGRDGGGGRDAQHPGLWDPAAGPAMHALGVVTCA